MKYLEKLIWSNIETYIKRRLHIRYSSIYPYGAVNACTAQSPVKNVLHDTRSDDIDWLEASGGGYNAMLIYYI